MKNTIVHHEGAAPLEVVVKKIKLSGSVIKIGLDVHARLYVAAAQYDQLLPKPGFGTWHVPEPNLNRQTTSFVALD